MARFSRKLLQPFTDAVIARKRDVKDGLLLGVDTGTKYNGLAVSDLKFTPRGWSPLGCILRFDYQPKDLLEFIQPEIEYPPKPATLVAKELESVITDKKIIGLVVSISDPPQEVKERPDYNDGTGHTKSFLEDCREVIGDIPTYVLEEHKTTRIGQRAAFQRAKEDALEMGYYVVSRGYYNANPHKVYLELEEKSRKANRTIKLMFKEDLVLTYLYKINKDKFAAGRLLDLYIEFEAATFSAVFEEQSFIDYFRSIEENGSEKGNE